MEIDKITWDGFLDFRRVHPKTWPETRTFMQHTYGVFLPKWDDLPAVDRDQLRVLLSKITVRIFLKGGGVWVYTFKPGYLTDFASVPKFLRGLLDNDDLALLIAALVHDANFAAHFLTFLKSNKLFKKMVIDPGGGSWWMSQKAYWGVTNFIAYNIYENKTDQQIKQARSCCKFQWLPKVQGGF